jgi:peroxiredoxin
MTIRIGDRVPEAAFTVMGTDGPELRTTGELFSDRVVALFAMPGAYTPVCHREHLPGIIAVSSDLMSRGVDTIACTAVNDIFVLERWAEEHGNAGRLLMLADGNAEFALKAGLAVDLSKFGLGIRSNRYVMLVGNCTVRLLEVEDALLSHDKSSAKNLCRLMA